MDNCKQPKINLTGESELRGSSRRRLASPPSFAKLRPPGACRAAELAEPPCGVAGGGGGGSPGRPTGMGSPVESQSTSPASLTAHYHSIRQVRRRAQPRPPRCMFNIQQNDTVTANTKPRPHHLIASRFKSCYWPGPVWGECGMEGGGRGRGGKDKNKAINPMQSACN